LQDFAPAFGFASREPVPGTELPSLDFVSIAKGMGCAGRRVETADLLREALVEAFAASGPMLIETVVEDRYDNAPRAKEGWSS